MFVLCRLHGIVDREMYLKLVQAVEKAKLNNKFILLHINCVGGENRWSMMMRKLLFSCHDMGIETYAVGYKKVHSAALLIYLSCVFRFAYKETKFLIHEPDYGESRESKLFAMRSMKIIFSYYTHVTKFTLPELCALARKETYLDYDEAKEKGIINSEWKIKSESRKIKIAVEAT